LFPFADPADSLAGELSLDADPESDDDVEVVDGLESDDESPVFFFAPLISARESLR